jgi:hypothetical protein
MKKTKKINEDQICGRQNKRPGNLEPALGVTPAISEMRTSWQTWVEDEVSRWASIAFITLKFKMNAMTDHGHVLKLDEPTAKAEVKKFGSSLDKAVYGKNRVRRFNTRVRRIPFLEYGSDLGWHCHIMIERPEGISDARFVHIVRQAWSRSQWSSGRPDIRDGDANLPAYLVKFRSKQEFEAWGDTIILEGAVARAK